MKKDILWSIMALMAVTLLSLGFAACGDDEIEGGDDDNNENVEYDVEGSWEGTFFFRETEDSKEEGPVTYTFYEDGTGRRKEVYPSNEEPNSFITTFTFTKTSDKKGVITYTGEDYTYSLNYLIEGKHITIFEVDPNKPLYILTRKATTFSEKGAAVGFWNGLDFAEGGAYHTFIFSKKEIWKEGFPDCCGMHIVMRPTGIPFFGRGFTYKENNGTEGTLKHSHPYIFPLFECYEIDKDRMSVYEAEGGAFQYYVTKMKTGGTALKGTWEGYGTEGMPLAKKWLSIQFDSNGVGTFTYEESHDSSNPKQNVFDMTYQVNEDVNICGVIRPSGDDSFFYILWNGQLHLMRLTSGDMLIRTYATLNKK